jgi:hypothetical protein
MKMKRILVLVSVLGLVAVSAAPGNAAAKPVKTTLYLHGTQPLGELESDGIVNANYLPMDTTKPTGQAPKSRQVTNYAVGPNTQCAGNALFPVWLGPLSGTVKGTVKVTLFLAGTPSDVDVRIWPDVNSSLCTNKTLGANQYPKPAGEVVVTTPPGGGQVTAMIKNVNFKAQAMFMIQLSPSGPALPAGMVPSFDRVLYDAASFASSVQFTCTPAKGTSCTK